MFCEKYTEKCQKNNPDDPRASDVTRGTINRKPNPKALEIMEVGQLTTDIKSSLKSSGIAEKLQAKRKGRHDRLMSKLANDLNQVNARTEENILISSEEVKAHMKRYKDRLQDKLKSLDTPEVASYHESVFLGIQREADCMKSHQLQLVQELYDELRKFENSRSEEYERIFQSSFQEIEKTAYFLPYELQSFIEHEALKINQLTLNNRRCYEDLRLKLILVTEQTFKSFMDEVFCFKEKWFRYNMQKTATLRHSRFEDKHDLAVTPEPQTRLELKRYELVLELTPDGCFSTVKAEEWFWNINYIRKALVSTKNMLTMLHQEVIKAVQNNLRSEDDVIKKSLLSLEPLQFEERSIQPIVFVSNSETEENIEPYELCWQTILRIVKGKLDDSFDLLENFGELWNRHIARLCESKILVMKAVEKAEDSTAYQLQELEEKVNLSLDALRQEYNEGKLETLHRAVVANLDAIKERLEASYTNEVTITEEYYNMMNVEADVLSAEIEEFVDLKLSEETRNDEPELGEISVEFGKKIQILSSEVASLDVWKAELRKALKNFATDTRDKLSGRAENWISSKVEEISRKYQTQMEMHRKRYDRIQSQIYEVRRRELYVHQSVFNEHKAGVEKVHENLTKAVENFSEKLMEKLDCCRNNVTCTVDEARKEDRAASLKFIQSQIQRQKTAFMTEVAMKAEQCQQEIDFRVSAVQQSNLKFMKSIRLFNENGNYDADEALSYITSLETIDKEISSEGKAVLRETKKRETEILQKASEVFDEAIRTLMQLDEELQFYGHVKNIVHLYRTDLQELSTALTDDFDLLNKHVDCMGMRIADETGFLSQKEDDLWFLLISVLYKNVSNLFYTAEVPEPLGNAVEQTEQTKDTTDEKKAQMPQPAKNTKTDHPYKDFREDIFDSSLLSDDAHTFMNSVCKKCWAYMDQLQGAANTFYKSIGGKTLERGDLLKPSYEDFAADIRHIFRSLALECEGIWLQIIRVFLPVLGNVKTLLKEYFERRVREFVQNVISALDDYELEFTNCFSKNSCNVLNVLQSLDGKLLALHGCPRNSHLLKSLEEEVVMKTAELELGWEVFMKEYEDKLKSIRKLCKPENDKYQYLKCLYTNCRNSIFTDKLGTALLHFTDEIVDKRGFIKKIEDEEDSNAAGKEAHLLNITATQTTDKRSRRHKLQRLPDADTYLREIKQIILREEKQISLISNAGDWMELLEPKLGLLTDAGEFEELESLDMKRIRTIHREIKEFVRSKTNFHEEVILEWLDRWKRNLERNSALYTVKYPADDDKDICQQRSNLNFT